MRFVCILMINGGASLCDFRETFHKFVQKSWRVHFIVDKF